MSAPPRRVRALSLLALVLAVAALLLASLREGHNWGGDFALYLLHARSLVEGTSYTDTGWIYNPEYPGLSPVAYPPVFPLMLAPFLALGGLNLELMKLLPVLSLALSLLAIHAVAARRLGHWAALGVAALVGLNPYLWHLRDDVKPDFTFMALTWAAFAVADALMARWDRGRPARGLAVALGAVLWLAYGTRSVGLLVAPAIALPAALRKTRRWSDLALAGAVALAPAAVQTLLIGGLGSYGDAFALTDGWLARNLSYYASVVVALFDNGHAPGLATVAAVVTMALSLVGWARRVRRGPLAVELWAPLYLATVIVWPYPLGRLLIPLVPALFLWAVEGAVALAALVRAAPRAPSVAAGAVIGALLVGSASSLAVVDTAPLQEGVLLPSSQRMFAFARQTEDDGVWVSSKPRPLALFTRHRTIAWTEKPDPEQRAWLARVGASHLVLASWSERDMRLMAPFVMRNQDLFAPVFQNEQLTVLRVGAGAGASTLSPGSR